MSHRSDSAMTDTLVRADLIRTLADHAAKMFYTVKVE
jgi:hypothetical protein